MSNAYETTATIMEAERVLARSEFCAVCLSTNADVLHIITLKFDEYGMNTNPLFACNLCKHLVQRAQGFIDKVGHMQKILNSVEMVNQFTLQAIKHQVKPPIVLTKKNLEILQLPGLDSEVSHIVSEGEKVDVKMELKVEQLSLMDADNDDHNYEQPTTDVHEEMLENLLKNEPGLQIEEIDYKTLKKSLKKKSKNKKCKVKSSNDKSCVTRKCNDDIVETVPKKNISCNNEFKDDMVELIHITPEENREEMSNRANEAIYIDSPFKCENCVKGFCSKDSYLNHMVKHSEISGDHICDICNLRFLNTGKLREHINHHKLRYRCLKCGLTRVSRRTVVEHFHAYHTDSAPLLPCPKCNKMFRRKGTLRAHLDKAHHDERKIMCDICKKLFINKASIKAHIRRKHTLETLRYACEECGARFHSKSILARHELKHTDQRDHYCVECDKSFKTKGALEIHLRTTMYHVTNGDLRYDCPHCGKKFAVKRSLQRHVNNVHLNTKPYQCDRCEKAYVSSWSLKAHIRITHEGHKLPPRFPCTMCDKVFSRNQVLKSHILTHTGERPHACPQCGAQFAQRSVMRTHVRLVHLKMARGRGGMS